VLRVLTLRVDCGEEDHDDDHEGEDVVNRSDLRGRSKKGISSAANTEHDAKADRVEILTV